MSATTRQNNEPYALEITDITATSERTVTVVLKDTGKAAVIRRDLAEFHGVRMFVPFWLAKRLLKPPK